MVHALQHRLRERGAAPLQILHGVQRRDHDRRGDELVIGVVMEVGLDVRLHECLLAKLLVVCIPSASCTGALLCFAVLCRLPF